MYIEINIAIIIFRHLIVMVNPLESQQHVQQIKEQQLMLKICFLMFQLEKGFWNPKQKNITESIQYILFSDTTKAEKLMKKAMPIPTTEIGINTGESCSKKSAWMISKNLKRLTKIPRKKLKIWKMPIWIQKETWTKF